MANDPNRDLLPVKEGSCIDTCRSSVAAYPVDFRERHAVCKLDRYELEDRHLRLLDEVQELKKYSNTQEEKIKRLSTKLMRVAKTPRTCISGGITGDNDRNKIQYLEIENAKLKDKITVLRNQILNHRVLKRSSSQTRRLQGSASSGPTTCRSDGGRLKMCASTNSINEQVDDLHVEKYINKIQELEAEREEIIARVSELESQLSMHLSGNQKEKVAENVEYIRVWRQMKQQQEKLNSMSGLNEALKAQIKDLKNLLDQTSKSKSEVTAALSVEKKRMSELEEEIIKSKDSHMSLRERDEQIRDLMSEMKILQQHNSELISLSTRYNKVDDENIELKRKISEQEIDNNSLKSAFNNEKTNITALQAANNQLMQKLQELQKNMDTLTIQLKSFQNQQEKSDRLSDELKDKKNKTVNKQTNTSPVKNKITNDSFDRQSIKNHNLVEAAVQTEFSLPDKSNSLSHKVTESLARNQEKSPKIGESPVRTRSNVPSTPDNHDHGAGNLSRDEMLKLLDNAQINTPLDSRNASQIRQIESFSPSSYGKTVHRQSLESEDESGYFSHRKSSRQESNREKIDESKYLFENKYKTCGFPSRTISQVDKSLQELTENSGKYGSVCSLNPVPGEFCNCEPENIPRKVFTRSFTVAPRPKNSVNFRQGHLDSLKPQKSTFSFDGSIKDNSLPEIERTPSLAIDQEGIVEIHIISLQLTPFAIDQLFSSEKKSQPSLFVTCDFCGQGNIFVPYLKFPNLNFKTSHTYKLSSIDNFFNCVVWQAIHLQIYAINPGGYPCAVAHAKVCVKDILNYPQIKLHYNATMNCIVPCYRDSNFGKLSFWIRLNCDVERINEFKLKHSESQRNRDSDQLNYEKSSSVEKLKKFSDEKSSVHGRLGKRKISDFSDNSKSPGSSKRASISYRSEESINQRQDGDNDRVIPKEKRRESWSTWSSGDYKLKDNRIKSIRDSKELGDPASESQFPDTSAIFSNNKFRFRRKSSKTHQKSNSKDSIVLKIKKLTLLPGSSIFQDPNIHQLYIEFSFLGYHGQELETESLPKPISFDDGSLSFNYEKRFFFDEETHLEQRSKLVAMLSGDANPNIKFTIVSEPLREEMNIKECLEVGYAYLNIREHILRNEVCEISLVVLNTTETNSIGDLEVAIVDSDVFRQFLKN